MSGKTSQNHRVAVVTGGAGAIGGAIVERLAPDHTVVVLDRTGDFVVDLSDPDDVRRAAKLVLDRHGRCDVFVHAAATFKFEPFEQVELDAWRRVQAVNVESALLLTQAFAPGMRDRAFGRVIFIIAAGALQVADLTSVIASIDSAPAAFERLRDANTMKILIAPDGP